MMRAALIRPSYCILILITGCHMRVLAQQRTVESDREALIALENKWLRSEHRATELDSILASDFVHPVVTGDLLDKAQHIHFSSTHLPPANRDQRWQAINAQENEVRKLETPP